jgi:hypothetical protein
MAVKIQKVLRSEKLCANWFIRIYSVQLYQVHHIIHTHSQPLPVRSQQSIAPEQQ